jgi:acyl-CoA thioesterase
MSFAELLAGAAPTSAGFDLAIPADWHQGRTAYGGFSAALALDAALRLGGEMPPLRSAQVSFVGPLYGPVEARARVLRRGRNATWASAEIVRGGETGLAASFVFMAPVPDSAIRLDARPLPEGVIPIDQAREYPLTHAPVFLREHFDIRWALPRGEQKRPEVCCWVRCREHGGLDPMVHLLLIADALPPGIMPLVDARIPVSSMTWQCNILDPAPATADGWWLMRASADYGRSGGSSERIEVWNANGAPVLDSMQSVALFG